jgi:hypothetical protein
LPLQKRVSLPTRGKTAMILVNLIQDAVLFVFFLLDVCFENSDRFFTCHPFEFQEVGIE